ncbi:uncharacterized protein LOC133151435 isoform X2 [Syngnathus typhle]|uniref:uncharacterized protein LOC133151435 isoform X2 n=1 Tax=Syngnathus typhle TaxID=161592 RepID=UPI002A6A1FBE|nr:uncharacterized protein LOC133151435 isoform X2 [Syngnathus typhle]
MSFTNLFASLSGSDAKKNDQSSFTVRGDIGKVQSTTSKKRTSEGEQPGPHTKKQRNWTQASKPNLDTQDYSKTFDYHVQLTDHKNKRAGFTKGSAYNCANQVSYSGPKFQTNHNGNRQQQTKQTKQQKGRQQKRGQPQNGGGRHQTKSSRKPADRTERRNHIQNRIKTRPVKYFTDEFKEQNILLVNEQMVCRHFLHGKCIKGDNCQMQHIEPENDLVKTRCKYYMQGACMKGEKCPFMHRSFPCKFFHKKGKCSKGDDCRFSHEPLNDITMKLLNEFMEYEMELAKKTEQSSVQSVTVDEPEVTQAPNLEEENKASDNIEQPFKFNFYNSATSNANEETCQSEEVDDVIQEDGQPCEPACQSSNLSPEPPVLYSVEAVLGLQSSGVFKTPISPNPTIFPVLPASPGCSDSENHCEVPYSVKVVLRASTSTDSSTWSGSPTNAAPTLQVVSYTPADERSSASPNNKASNLLGTQNKVLRETLKNTTALKVAQDSHCDDTAVPTTTSKVTEAEESPENMRAEHTRPRSPLQSPRRDKTQHLTTDSAQQLKSSKGGLQSLFSSPPHLISPQKHSPPSKSRQLHHFHSLSPSSQRSTQFKESASVPAALASPFSENNHLPLQCHTQSTLTSEAPKVHCSSGTTTHCKTDCLSVSAPNQTLQTPFKSLFARTIHDAQNSTISSITHNLTASPKSTNVKCQDPIKTTAEPDQPRASSLFSLFATPLGFHSPPSMSQPNHLYQPAALSSDTAQSDAPSIGGSSSPGTSNSVLKTLFLSLSPYQQDGP